MPTLSAGRSSATAPSTAVDGRRSSLLDLARCWFRDWRQMLLIVKPETVIAWHRKGWKAYWRWRSRTPANSGRHPAHDELRLLIRRMASENILWGQRRIQAELARLAFTVIRRTPGFFPHWRLLCGNGRMLGAVYRAVIAGDGAADLVEKDRVRNEARL